ncbi:MAG: CPBP family intramembrane metalloprotease [Saprospiraceae bacterium]|nr:CPBP family intramembrane metalloprotease [Saprospiraceae bacterium]
MFFRKAIEGRNSFLYSILFILLLFIGLTIGQIPFFLLRNYIDKFSIDTAQVLRLLLMLISYPIALFVGWWLYPIIHRRSFLTLISPSQRIDKLKIFQSFMVWFVLLIAIECVVYLRHAENYTFQFDAGPFFLLTLTAIILIPWQTSFEEVLFRGYLSQQFGITFNSKLVGITISSLLFGAMHLANPEVQAFGIMKMLFYYTCFGIFAGLCTLLDDRLEVVLGIHAANNIYGAIFVTFDESALQTPALFRLQRLDVNEMVWLFGIVILLFTTISGWKFQWFKKLHLFRDQIR